MPALIPLLVLLAGGLCLWSAAKKDAMPLWPSVFVVIVALLVMTWTQG